MKTVVPGCVGILAGLIVGIILGVGALSPLMRTDPFAAEMQAPLQSRGNVSVIVNAAFINSQVQQAARQTGLLKQATVTLEAPNVVQVVSVVDVTVLGQRISGNVLARMRATVNNGRIVLSVERVDGGSFPFGQTFVASSIESARAEAENQINLLVQRSLQGTGLRVSGIRMTSNEMALDLVSQ